jgi:glutaredoxin
MNPRILHCLAAALLAAPALPAMAVYKIVQPDGSVIYTDRPPATGSARVMPLGRDAAPAMPELALPQELRSLMQRYPVTLYTSADCTPCDNGRRLLQLRGVPYLERLVSSEEDALALERAVGGRTVPALTIGAQALRGLSETDWTAFLDAAGYPRESRLPRGWQAPAPAPLVERTPARPPQAAPTARPADAPTAPAVPVPEPAPGSLRF